MNTQTLPAIILKPWFIMNQVNQDSQPQQKFPMPSLDILPGVYEN